MRFISRARLRDGARAINGSFGFIERRKAQAVQLEHFWGHFRKLFYKFFHMGLYAKRSKSALSALIFCSFKFVSTI